MSEFRENLQNGADMVITDDQMQTENIGIVVKTGTLIKNISLVCTRAVRKLLRQLPFFQND